EAPSTATMHGPVVSAAAGPAEPATSLTLSPPPREMRRISHYEVLGELGRGTFGVVFRARDERLGRDVAIKVLHVGARADAEELARFNAEAAALASLQHPNIVHVHEAGTHLGAPYLVMELVDGGNLFERL